MTPKYRPDPHLTPDCRAGRCTECDGVIVNGTGHNWFCVCAHHPEPTPIPRTPAADQAIDYWRTIRARR